MKKVKFKGGLKRQHNEGTLGMSVHSGISYKQPRRKKPKTIWEKFKEWCFTWNNERGQKK
tara:strand:- start:274 stop:453 length:180 start_codon:yes stop_codon:yes gene_type:complete